MKRIFALSLYLLLAQPFSVFANFENANQLYAAGKFEQARVAFEALMAVGDRGALFNIGVMHYRGQAFDKDIPRAVAFMRIANKGLDDESFSGTVAAISTQFTAKQLQQSETIYQQLLPRYGIKQVFNMLQVNPLDDEDCEPERKNISAAHPRYPLHSALEGRMGVVNLSYTISPEGYVRDAIAISETSADFIKPVFSSLRTYRFVPASDGLASTGHRRAYTFMLDVSGRNKRMVKEGRLKRDLEELKLEAQNGSAAAQYVYAQRLNVFRHFKDYLKKTDLQYRTANEWLQKSAQGGLANAQYEIGLNLIKGQGCEVDEKSGFKWLTAAAVNGYYPAQRSLAQSALANSEINDKKTFATMNWLRNAARNNDYAAKVLLAWELATTANAEYRDGHEAIQLLKEKSKIYHDPVRVQEGLAAAYAELGNFKKAVKHQKKAQKLAKKNGWKIPLIAKRLSLYEHGQGYRGSYY